MKRLVLIVQSILLVAVFASGQEMLNIATGKTEALKLSKASTIPTREVEIVDNSIIVAYNFTNVMIFEDNLNPGSKFLKITGFCNENTPTHPSVLTRRDLFALPNANDIKIRLLESDFVEYDIPIAPARPLLTDSEDLFDTYADAKPIDSGIGIYPESIVNNEGYESRRNVDVLSVSVFPIQYDVKNKKTRIYTKIKYEIVADVDLRQYYESLDSTDDPVLENVVTKAISWGTAIDHIDSLYLTKPNIQDYLIVTVPKYMRAVKRFASWKQLMGFNTHILSRDSWNNSPETVKNAIQNAYEQYPDIKYLLIVGDVEDVPAKQYESLYNNLYGNFVTDRFYASLNSDNSCEFYYGRVSVSSAQEAATVLNKIINYEKSPVTDASFYNNGINCAYFQDEDSRTDRRDSYEDRWFIQTSEIIRDAITSKFGKNVARIYYAKPEVNPKFYSTESIREDRNLPSELLRPNFSWDGDKDDIISKINNGVLYALHRDHGDFDKWSVPEFNVQDIDSLNNGNKLPVVFSINCLSGKFNVGTCFAEKFLRYKNGGCVGIFAASCVSYSKYNDVLACGMFDAIWPSDKLIIKFPNITPETMASLKPTYRLGQILEQGLYRMSEYNFSNESLTYQKRIFHCHGDPSMQIYSRVPTSFRNQESMITKSDNLIQVNARSLSTITFIDNKYHTFKSYTGTEAKYSTAYPDYVTVCVAAPNKIPYIVAGERTIPDGYIDFDPIIDDNPNNGMIADGIVKINSSSSSSTVEIKYNLNSFARSASIIITNVFGSKELTINNLPTGHNASVTTQNLPSGLHIATLVKDEAIIGSLRFAVSK